MGTKECQGGGGGCTSLWRLQHSQWKGQQWQEEKVEKSVNKSLLERKQDQRAATRMAAEARHRREHPMPSMPRRALQSGRGRVLGE